MNFLRSITSLVERLARSYGIDRQAYYFFYSSLLIIIKFLNVCLKQMKQKEPNNFAATRANKSKN